VNVISKSVDDIRPYANNPRNNAAAIDKVAASIRAFGFKVPIVIDREGTIITGHTRLLAAQRLGMPEVPCVVADDLTPEQVRAFRIADNKVAEYAEWDIDKLAQEIAEIRETDFDVTLTGFDDAEIADLIGEPDLDDDQFDPDEDAARIVKPISQQGDIWHLGDHRLMCGDATDAADVSRLMGGGIGPYGSH
jgi:ParB-like chromosome segregation protein Spo0J